VWDRVSIDLKYHEQADSISSIQEHAVMQICNINQARGNLPRRIAATVAVVLAFSFLNISVAQNYPDRPVRLVVGLAPGGGVDFIARTLGPKLSDGWSQPVVVENRPGANGIIGTEYVAKSKPDGLTVLIVNSAHAINPGFYRKLPYNTQADLDAVTLLAQYPFLLIVHPALPARTVKELIAVAKARPGQLVYGSSGNGSAPHLGIEIFKSMANVNILHVPYTGAGPAITNIVSGELQLMLLNLAPVKGLLQTGRLRALAIASPARSSGLPDVPTATESGLPGFNVVGWYGMLLPAGVLQAVRAKLHADVVRALRSEDIKQRWSSENTEPVGNTPDEFSAFLKSETAKFSGVINRIGIKAD
jgi:tripartite-type tricarboxylate transporter receptor subunit TctC